MKRTLLISALALIALAVGPVSHASDAGGRLRATLDGKPLRAENAGRYHCHDLDSPVISCFRTSAELVAAVEPRIAAAEAEAVSYVRIWENAEQGGPSAYLAEDYANLGAIGWNDRITSFKSVNGGAGTFFHDVNQSGTSYSFCCNQTVPNVGATHNDKFSSVERD